MLKTVLTSKNTRYVFSIGLLYIAFQKVDILSLLKDLVSVPWWATPSLVAYFSITMFIGGWRWAILVLDKVKFSDVLVFTKSTFMGMFYGLFFPTPMAGDLVKWTTLLKTYPNVAKTKLVGSILIDRIVGFTTLCFIALMSMVVGKTMGYDFPQYLWFLFIFINIGTLIFFVLILGIDFEKIIARYNKLQKVSEIIGLFRKTNKKDLLFVFLLCLVSEPIWMSLTWLIALVFGLDLHLIDVLIFMPVIALILTLPISVAGFGARETLFVYFFSQLGLPADKILAVSTYNGIIGVLVSLVGGLLTFF